LGKKFFQTFFFLFRKKISENLLKKSSLEKFLKFGNLENSEQKKSPKNIFVKKNSSYS